MRTFEEVRNDIVETLNKIESVPQTYHKDPIYVDGQRNVFAVKIITEILSKLEYNVHDSLEVLEKVSGIIQQSTKLDTEYIKLDAEVVTS